MKQTLILDYSGLPLSRGWRELFLGASTAALTASTVSWLSLPKSVKPPWKHQSQTNAERNRKTLSAPNLSCLRIIEL